MVELIILILHIVKFWKIFNYDNFGNRLIFQIRNCWNFLNWKINKFPESYNLKNYETNFQKFFNLETIKIPN